MSGRIARLVILLTIAGCSPNLALDSETRITCRAKADCPSGWQCNLERGICEELGGNSAPEASVTALVVGRPLVDVPIEVRVSDPNGAPNGDQRVTIELQFSLGDDVWCRPTALTGELADRAATAASTSLAVTWDALADAQCLADAACAPALACAGVALPVASIDSDDDGLADTEQVGWTPTVTLRVAATDSGSPALSSGWVTSASFALGNDPPFALLELGAAEYRGIVPIPFQVIDPALDLARVEIEYQLPDDPEPVWLAAAISQGSTEGLATNAAAGSDPTIVLWDTRLATGIGRRNIGAVALRMRALDEPVPGVEQAGAWSEPVTVSIRNQATPQAQALAVLNGFLTAEVTGALLLAYDLVDDEEDLIDVKVEYSANAGSSWLLCTEYPSSVSEGRYDLLSAKASPVGASGVRHLFAWDVIADLVATRQRVQVRVTPADDGGVGSPALYGVGPLVGFAGSLDDGWVFAKQTPTALAANSAVRLGDFNGDGIRDLAFGTSAGFSVRFGSGGGVFGSAYAHTFGSPAMPGVDLAVADLDADGADDLVARGTSAGDPGVFQAFVGHLGSPQALAKVGVTFGSPHVVGSIALGDLTGDDVPDLVSVDWGSVRGFAGNGDGTFGAATTLVSGQSVAIAVADFDGNGVDDLAQLATTHRAAATTISRTPVTLTVYLGDVAGSPGAFALRAAQTVSYDLRVADNGDANVTMGNNPFSGTFIRPGDVNEDGRADVVIAHYGAVGSELLVCPGAAAQPLASCTSANLVGKPMWLTVLEATDGARPDLLVRVESTTEDRIQLYRWRQGTTGAPYLGLIVDALNPGGTGLDRALGADLNDDGLCDLVGFAPAEQAVFLANGEGQLAATLLAQSSLLPIADRVTAIASSDGDLDGVSDALLIAEPNGTGVAYGAWLRSASERGAVSRPLQVVASTGLVQLVSPGTDQDFRIGDFTGDGALDLITYDPKSPILVGVIPGIADRAGTGLDFGAPVTINGLGSGQILAGLGDMNADGFDDLVMSAGTGNQVWPAAVTGGAWAGTFSTSASAASGSSTYVTRVADLDRDGYADVLGLDFGVLAHYFGDGTGALTATCNFTVSGGQATWAGDVADLDGDERLDVVLAVGTAATGSRLRVFRGTSTRCTYTEVTQDAGATVAAVVRDLVVADVDSDGTLDVVTGMSPANPVVATPVIEVWRGLTTGGVPNGKLAAPVAVSSAWQGPLALADLNSDGLLDLVSASSGATGVPYGVAIWQGRRATPWHAWSVPLVLTQAGAGWRLSEEAGVAPPITDILDRFGEPRQYRMTKRPYVAFEPRTGNEPRHDHVYEALRRDMGWTAADGYRPLTAAWDLRGDRARRLVDAASHGAGLAYAGRRLQTWPRFAPMSSNLGPSLDADRSLEVTLPFLAQYGSLDVSAKEVQLFVRRENWLTAPEWPDDPLAGLSEAADLLACAHTVTTTAGLECAESLFSPDERWESVPKDADGNLATGSGPRFVVESDAGGQRLRVVTDALGIFLAVMR